MLDIEIEGLELLLSAIRHPAFDGNPLARQLFIGFSQEWAARQAGEAGPDLTPLKYEGVNDKEIKVVAGMMHGIAECKDVRRYWKTVTVCTAILQVCLDELEARSAKGQTVQ
jgi:hypothetical protein